MLDGILGRGFSSKCKSLIKPTRTRIDVLRRRQTATQRFLKGNLAQLLANGLDINAYGRVKQTEEFLAGLNLLSCYDIVEQSCEYILKQLSIMQKQRECPQECREAVGSLMFAAARFSDLPELRDLRDTFQERYGGSLEHFVNQEFVEKLALRPPTIEEKIKLLQGIALEFSIKWDSRGFEQRMANPAAFAQGQPTKHVPAQDHDNKYKLPNGKESVIKTEKGNHSFKARSELSDKHSMQNGKEDNLLKRDDLDHHFFGREGLTGHKYQAKGERNHKPLMGEQMTPKRDNHGIPFRGRGEFIDDKRELSSVNGKEDAVRRVGTGSSSRAKRPEFVDCGYDLHDDKVNHAPKRDGQGPVYDGKPEVVARVAEDSGRRGGKDASPAGYNAYGQPNTANSPCKVQEQETDRLKPYCSNGLPPPYIKSRDKLVPPPYIKSKESKYGVSAEAKHPSSDSDEVSIDSSVHKKGNAVHRSKRIQGESDRTKYENAVLGPERPFRDDLPLPKPRSIRRKHSKSSTSHEDLGNYEDTSVAKKSSSSRRRDYSRRGLQVLFDDEHYRKDDEERMIDKLLMHYSKKPSTFEPEKLRRKSKAYALDQQPVDAGECPHYGRDGPDVRAEMVHPTRSTSLPHEQTAPAEAVKIYARANSFQPDKPAGHVHPKLPDYDDLAARFAALKGR